MFGSRSGMMAERVLPSVFGGGELRDLVWMSLFAILIWKNMQSSMIPSHFLYYLHYAAYYHSTGTPSLGQSTDPCDKIVSNFLQYQTAGSADPNPTLRHVWGRFIRIW